MVSSYWIKQGFLGVIFAFSEIFIFLALMSSRNYLAVVIWILHLWPVGFMLILLKKKISNDIQSFSLDFFKNVGDNIKNNLEEMAQDSKENGTKGPSTD